MRGMRSGTGDIWLLILLSNSSQSSIGLGFTPFDPVTNFPMEMVVKLDDCRQISIYSVAFVQFLKD